MGRQIKAHNSQTLKQTENRLPISMGPDFHLYNQVESSILFPLILSQSLLRGIEKVRPWRKF